MPLVYPTVLAVLLFCAGLYGVLARRNAVLMLMSVELMLAAVSLNLVAFDVWLGDSLHSGQVFTLFLIALAAAEIGIGLAIVLLVYRSRGTVAIDRLPAPSAHGDSHAVRGDPGAVGSAVAVGPPAAGPPEAGSPGAASPEAASPGVGPGERGPSQ